MGAGTLIAIVDDDDSFRIAMEGLVRSLGHAAVGFSSAEAFLGWRDGRRADCVVSDVHMPGMSGLDLGRRLAAEGDATPLILVTARTERTICEQARSSGALCLLRKPFDPQALVDCLAAALDR